METPKKIAMVTEVVIWITLVCAAAVYVAIPWLVDSYLFRNFSNRAATFAALYVGGAGAIWLVIEFLRLMRTVVRGTPFVYANVRSLRHIGVCCMICSAAIIFMLFFDFSVTLLICVGILLFGLLCSAVLAALWKKAVDYKQENDLTI